MGKKDESPISLEVERFLQSAYDDSLIGASNNIGISLKNKDFKKVNEKIVTLVNRNKENILKANNKRGYCYLGIIFIFCVIMALTYASNWNNIVFYGILFVGGIGVMQITLKLNVVNESLYSYRLEREVIEFVRKEVIKYTIYNELNKNDETE